MCARTKRAAERVCNGLRTRYRRTMNLMRNVSGVVLACSVGAAGCSTAVSTTPPPSGDTCMTDTTVECVTGAQGWSCTGSGAQPEDYNADLVCSTDGAGDYCCSTSTCSYDSSVSGC